jgi:cobalt-zinc-cadmium resistance protein CzcA
MLEKIIAWSLSHRIAVLLGAAVVCLIGWVAVNRIVFDAFPDTTPVQVQINTVAPGMVAEEIERQITFPIELSMGGMPGLEGLRSASMFGLSVVIVTFRDGTDIYFARQLINERLTTVSVPGGVERPEMGPVSTGLGEVFHYLLVPKRSVGAAGGRDWRHEPDRCEDPPGMDAQAGPAERAGRGRSERLGRSQQAVSDPHRPRPVAEIRALV